MVKRKAKSKRSFHFRWLSIVACLLTILGLVSLTGFMLIHWTERQILTTENWVKVVATVPQNEQVATALSDYTVTTLSNSIDLEAKVTQALPDRAAFLGPTITDQLENRLKIRTKSIIQSDEFGALWQNANRLASQKILERARSDQPASPAPARFNIDLKAFKSRIQSLLNTSSSDTAPPNGSDQDINVGTDLKTSLQKLKTYIRAVDFLNGTLGLFALVCLLGALIASRLPRRLLIIISLSVVVICLLQLIGVKTLRPAILNRITNEAYRPAVGVVYDTLLASFKSAATTVGVSGAILALLAYLTQPRLLKSNKTIAKFMNTLKHTVFWQWCAGVRASVGHYLLYIMAAAILIWLVGLAFLVETEWPDIIRALLFLILFFEVCKLVATRPEVPMKQAKK